MTDPLITAELMLRGVAVGALAACALGIWRVASGRPTGVAALLLCIAAISHAAESSGVLRTQFAPAMPALKLISLSGTGFVWLFVVTLFEDRPIEPKTLAPAAILTVPGLAASTLPDVFWLLHKFFEAGLALHALSIVVRTWRGDLVESRARIRVPFLAIVALYVPLNAGFYIAASYGVRLPLRDLVNAGALAAISLAGVAIFLRAPLDLLGVARPSETPLPDAADPALSKLDRAMDADELWRREGLTIGALADAVGVPEHRLRPLINRHLGFRNFAAFINARRIEAAKRLLVDPAKARVTVAAIAYELGFGSLGPFNRAFKEATGVTPTEFRRTQGSPISEISR